jgi:hypothetical protein
LPLAAATLFASPSASAQTRAGSEFRVNTYTQGAQARPRAALLRGGGFVVAWQSDGQDGGSYGVFAQRYQPSGAAAGAEIQVNAYVTGWQRWPEVEALPGGGFLVVWSGAGPGDPDEGIFARRYDGAGAARGAEFRVNTATAGTQYRPTTAVDPRGGFVVVWAGQDGSAFGVFGQRYDASGAPLGGEFRVNTYTADWQYAPQVAMAADGRYLVAWSSFDQDGDSWGVYAQGFDPAGAPVGGEFQVNTYTWWVQTQPRVAMDASGRSTIAWTSTQDGSFLAVVGQRFDAAGARVGGEFVVNTGTFDDQHWPDVAADPSGNLAAVWQTGPFLSGTSDVFARRFDRSGAARGGDFRVPVTAVQRRLQQALGSDRAGNFVVAWTSIGQDGSGYGVFAQRFGGLIPAAASVDAAPSSGSDGNGVFEAGETVAAELAWTNRNGQPLTFAGAAAAFTGPGTAGNPDYAALDAAADYGTVANGATSSCATTADCYLLQISTPATRPARHWDATLVEDILPVALGHAYMWPLHVGGSFDDVPKSNPFYRFVETLLHNGVTGGCTSTSFCPGARTTRAEMAPFVLASATPSDVPPACVPGSELFADVPAASPFCRWVEELARRAVTGGCGGGSYCPEDPVSRAQMAVFLLRAREGPAYTPPACGAPVFLDVPAASPFCPWIEELARRGIAAGCGGGNYCPDDPVTREQMSAFLTATFALALYGS